MDAVDPADIWREDRDEVFLNRLTKDITQLMDAGIPADIVWKVICQYKYVQAWANCPRWLWPVDKLPKGYKWSDGERHHIKAGKRCDARTIILLPVGDDLYVRDTFWKKSKKYRVRDFRRYAAKDIEIEFSLSYGDFYLSGLILEFYKKQGLPLGYVERLPLKDMRELSAKNE